MSGKSVSLAMFGVLAISVMSIACGGSSGGTRPGGTGGATGDAAVTGTGGSTGGGGSTAAGTGGATSSSSSLNCMPGMTPAPVDPANGVLTTFTSGTDWSSTTGKWGVAGNLQGSIYAYNGSMTGTSTWKAGVDTTAGALDLGIASGTAIGPGVVGAGDYAGGGVQFSTCVNTSTYTGVSFTLSGEPAGCDIYFAVKTWDEQGISNGGGCDASSCYSFPQEKIAIGSDTTVPIVVHFSDVTGGMPTGASAIAMQIVGFQWQLQSGAPPDGGTQAACTNAELTIDNITLVK
jgi:hypothetical protein